MSVPQDDFLRSHGACPRCRSRLTQCGDCFQCTDRGCEFFEARSFPVVAGRPVLVDFEQSILDERQVLHTSAASTISRKPQRWRRIIKDVLFRSDSIGISRRNAERLRDLLKARCRRPVVLMVGGASQGIGTEPLYDDPHIRIVSFDIYNTPLTDFVADGHRIPLIDECVDAVWIQYVLEHVLDPWSVVCEAHRVLKRDGFVYAETPFMQQVHEGAYDFTRFTPSGHRWLFRRYEQVDAGVVMGAGLQVLWTIDHLSRALLRSERLGKAMKCLFFWVRFLDRFASPRIARDNASAVYFFGCKSQTELKPADIVPYYREAA